MFVVVVVVADVCDKKCEIRELQWICLRSIWSIQQEIRVSIKLIRRKIRLAL